LISIYASKQKTKHKTDTMQLRNGKRLQNSNKPVQNSNGNPVQNNTQIFVETTTRMLDVCQKTYATASPLDKITNVLRVFEFINQQPIETLTGMHDNYKFLSTIYKKTVGLTCVIIKRSYMETYADHEKVATIRILSEMYKARQRVMPILWSARTNENVRKILDNGDGGGHADLLYRCLKHIVSDESESCDYMLPSYEANEYTDVELYDWYLLPNYGKVAESDPYVRNADVCFGEAIRRFNAMLWA
jgi:hypothetical protein